MTVGPGIQTVRPSETMLAKRSNRPCEVIV